MKNEIKQKVEKESGKFTLQWHILERCNLRCKHCYQNDNYRKEEMSPEKKRKVIDDLVYFCSKIERIPRIAFTGGEPFVMREELYELLKYCKDKYPILETSILTNGTLLKEEDMVKLKFLNVRYVQVSLDGGKKETHDFIRGEGNFDKAIDAIKLLTKNIIRTAVMFVFHKKNYEEVPELIDFCDSLGVDHLGITELVPVGRGKGIEDFSLSPLQTKELFILIAKKQIEIIKKKEN